MNIANIFKIWIGNFFDFYDNANLYGKLVSFVNRIKKSKDKSHALFATIIQESINSFNTQKQAYEAKIVINFIQFILIRKIHIWAGRLF